MTTSTQPRHPLSIGQTIVHLALLGTVGWGVIGAFLGLLSAGIGLMFVLGVGVILLVGLVYALFGIAWFEVARTNGLYRLNAPQLTFAARSTTTFGGWIRSLGRQLSDAAMWKSLANFLLASTLGTVLVGAFQALVWSVAVLAIPSIASSSRAFNWGTWFTHLSSTQYRLLGLAGVVVTLAAILGIALLHRVLSIALIGSRSREAALEAAAQQAAADAHRASTEAAQASAEARESEAQREGAVRSADVERTRIERDLHDGVQPRLVSVGMTLGLAQQTIDNDPVAAKALIAEAHTSTKAAITELRQLARGIHASVLDDRGLDAALSALAGRSHIPVVLDVRMDGSTAGGTTSSGTTSSSTSNTYGTAGSVPAGTRVTRAAEAAVYFVIAECLTNAAKHSRASECRVVVRVRSAADNPSPNTPATNSLAANNPIPMPLTLWARVEDNGVGGAVVQPGGGLDGISNRVRAAGGSINIDSPAGGPTTVEVSVPCAF